jgi:hypothetical protein
MRKKILIAVCVLSALAAAATAQEADKAIKLKGQVVCSLCWFEADRKTTPYGTEGDLKCAVACSKSGVPTALAVAGEREATLYLLEDGKFGKVGKGWLEYIGKYVEATGTVHERNGKRCLQVDALTLVPSAEAAHPAPSKEFKL